MKQKLRRQENCCPVQTGKVSSQRQRSLFSFCLSRTRLCFLSLSLVHTHTHSFSCTHIHGLFVIKHAITVSHTCNFLSQLQGLFSCFWGFQTGLTVCLKATNSFWNHLTAASKTPPLNRSPSLVLAKSSARSSVAMENGISQHGTLRETRRREFPERLSALMPLEASKLRACNTLVNLLEAFCRQHGPGVPVDAKRQRRRQSQANGEFLRNKDSTCVSCFAEMVL